MSYGASPCRKGDVVHMGSVLAEHLAAERLVHVLERRRRTSEWLGEEARGVREVRFEHAVVDTDSPNRVDKAWTGLKPEAGVHLPLEVLRRPQRQAAGGILVGVVVERFEHERQ